MKSQNDSDLPEINENTRIGKIYQIPRTLMVVGWNKPLANCVYIQTFGPPQQGSIKCTSAYELKKILLNAENVTIFISSVSSFGVNEEINSWLRIACCKGCTLYLHTYEMFRVWFVDEVLNSANDMLCDIGNSTRGT